MSEWHLRNLREVRRSLEDIRLDVSVGGKPIVARGGWFHNAAEENRRYELVNRGLRNMIEGIDSEIIRLLSAGSAPKSSFTIGQVVRLKSGGPEMTVCETGYYRMPGHVGVNWFLSDGTAKYDSFPTDTLVEVKEETR